MNSTDNTRKIFKCFLFFSSYVAAIFGMDVEPIASTALQKDILIPKKTFMIFDPKKAFESRKPWQEVVPGSMSIIPDEKGVVIAKRGQVYRLDFNTFTTPPTLLFEHASVKHCPMIAVAQKNNEKDDKLLLIVSAGNYENPDKEGYVSEYIIYQEDAPYQIQKLRKYTQLIKLSSDGKMLVICTDHGITVVDREKNDIDTVPFKDQLLTDVAINPDNTKIICIGSQGAIKLVEVARLRDKMSAYSMKQVATDDVITSISYSDQKKLFYLTNQSEAKIIKMYDFLENSPVDLLATKTKIDSYDVKSISGGNVKSRVFIREQLSYDLATIDQSSQCSVAYVDEKDNSRQVIVHCKYGKSIKKFVLTMPVLERTYTYITETRQSVQGRAGLLRLALRGSHVVALGTDGKMYLWTLPQNQIQNQILPSTKSASIPHPVTDVPKRKKSSSSRLIFLKGSSGSSKSGSKSSSSPSSPENSPCVPHSKRGNSTTGLVCNDSNEGL